MKRKFKKGVISILVIVLLFTTALLLPKGENAEVVKAVGITIHFKWTGDIPHLYYENVNGSKEATINYPGVPMTDEQNGWFAYTIEEAESADIILSIPEKEFQTTSTERKSGDWWFDGMNWYTENPEPATVQEAVAVEKAVAVKQNNAPANKVTVHCYSASEVPTLYYWNSLPSNMETVWPGVAMKEETTKGWYSYTFSDITKINVLFNIGATQSDDYLATAGEWWYTGSVWTSKDPSIQPTQGPIETPVPGSSNDFRDETIYFLMTTRFYDGDSSNNVHCTDDVKAGNPDSDPAWRGDFKG